MARDIVLTKGRVARVDDEDWEWLSQWRWHYNNGYAMRNVGPHSDRRRILMHRLILNTPEGVDTDHIDRDRLNNTRANLRICTDSQNIANRPASRNNKSGYKGVWYDARRKKWQATIERNRRKYHLGAHATPEEAARAYDTAAREFWGEFAWVNFVEEEVAG